MSPNRTLRRILTAEAAVSAGTAVTLVVLTIFAFDVGGTQLLGLALSLRFIGVGLVRPAAGVAIDRVSPIAGVRLGAAILVLGAVVSLAGGVIGDVVGVTFVIAGLCVLKLGHSISKAGRRASIAAAADTSTQAAATIGLLSLVTATSGLAGPTLAAAVLVVANELGALAVATVLYAVAAASMWGLPLSSTRPQTDATVRHVLAGQKETLKAPFIGWAFVLLGTSSFLNAALGVFYAPLAIESLGAGEEGVGYLRAAFGLGAILMSVALLSAATSVHPGRRLAVGAGLLAAMIAVVEPSTYLLVAFLPMLGMGAAKTLVDTSYLTHLHRALPDQLHQRVLGLGETVSFAAGASGSLLVIPLTARLELWASMSIVGLLGVAMAGIAGLRLRRVGARTPPPQAAVDLVRRTETFGLLPPIEIDLVALRMQTRTLGADEVLVSQGDVGTSWYIIASGDVDVSVDGNQVATMGPGDSFGEIALLRSSTRTATLRATADVSVHELDGAVFRRAIGVAEGHSFDSVIAERLARSAPADYEGER